MGYILGRIRDVLLGVGFNLEGRVGVSFALGNGGVICWSKNF